MTVKDLKAQLKGVPDNAPVWIGVSRGKCIEMVEADNLGSGYADMGEPCDIEGNPIEEKDYHRISVFCMYPKGLVNVED